MKALDALRQVSDVTNIPIKEIAGQLGVSRGAVYQWKQVPPAHVIPLERLGRGAVTRQQMRPDLYPE